MLRATFTGRGVPGIGVLPERSEQILVTCISEPKSLISPRFRNGSGWYSRVEFPRISGPQFTSDESYGPEDQWRQISALWSKRS